MELTGDQMPRGRPRIPRAVLELTGGYRPHRHDGRQEPQPEGLPRKPRGLDRVASKHWDVIVPQLVKLGLATLLDESTLAAMCRWYSTWHAVDKQLQEEVNNQAVMAANTAWKAYYSIACKFGLDPQSRANLNGKPPESIDPFTLYMKKRNLA